MIDNETDELYFNWLCGFVVEDRFPRNGSGYSKLLEALYGRYFYCVIDRDRNRAMDGEDLRYQYSEETGRDIPRDDTCSVLEMMVALSLRCETIMDDPNYGDRVGQWFWNMVVSLGVGSLNDKFFNIDIFDVAIDKFLNRKYLPDGTGGLFTIPGCKDNLRNVEIWIQMCWYLDYICHI